MNCIGASSEFRTFNVTTKLIKQKLFKARKELKDEAEEEVRRHSGRDRAAILPWLEACELGNLNPKLVAQKFQLKLAAASSVATHFGSERVPLQRS